MLLSCHLRKILIPLGCFELAACFTLVTWAKKQPKYAVAIACRLFVCSHQGTNEPKATESPHVARACTCVARVCPLNRSILIREYTTQYVGIYCGPYDTLISL